MGFFRYLESRIRGTASPGPGEPPAGLLAFYWHFVRQTKIRYGRPRATDAEVEMAARRAHAHEFVTGLQDWKGRTGYEAHVGEPTERARA